MTELVKDVNSPEQSSPESSHNPNDIPLPELGAMHSPTEADFRHIRENEALLPGPHRRRTRQRTPKALLPRLNNWKPHPFWLIPIVFVASMSRGVTMSPRIQVYKAVACRVLNEGNDSPGLGIHSLAVDCSSSEVQARAARIQASVVTLMSVLSAISTGFWSRLGDSHGRKPILAIFLAGAIGMEACYVLVMQPKSIFGRHAEKFILAGPILEGLVGGLSSFNGIVHAYTSDCTRHGSRSKIFSTIQGIVFVGLAMGPWFSGLVLPKTAILNVDHAFYLSISLLALTLSYVTLLCPESHQPMPYELEVTSLDTMSFKASPVVLLRRYLHRFLTALLIPIAMFAPRSTPGSSRRNYNLTLVGAGLFTYIISTGIYSMKYLYAQHVYTWTAAELGYYMSLLWISRAFNLLVFLPVIISYLKRKIPRSDSVVPSPEKISAEMRLDKLLAQGSLAVDGLADTLVALAPTSSQATYIGLSCLSSFTSGGNPALHSLGAVCLHACGFGSEVGALFGGIAVLSAIGHIISPYIYALTYGSTVAYFPKAIFCLAAGLLGTVVLLLSGINSRPEAVVISGPPVVDEDEDEDPANVATDL
ncbi:putative membrane protein C14C4.07 [Hypsizygus marmoreus]|uniref:Membrane protein C14C4.07 n=1 Tax=Hypsizygus marmoreus TaxID=39966 RepID=A0A369JU43_HYPMA|nr:putative membrane protein C14C4.07 [Hypsizygus marmoreus]